MPGPDTFPGGWHGGGPGAWHGGPPFRLPRAFTLWAPVLLSFAVQVPAALWIAASHSLTTLAAVLLIGIAVVGPVVLIGARRWPGPVVAVTAIAAAADAVFNQVG